MTKSIRVREYTSMMIAARRVSRKPDISSRSVAIERTLLVQLLDTLDDLTGMDTTVPNKITMKVPR